jgi:hypothetical protein
MQIASEMGTLQQLLGDSFGPSLEDVPIFAEFAIRVALRACFLDLTAITLLYTGKKRLTGVSEVDAVYESFGSAASNEIRGMGDEVDVPDLIFI